MKKEDLFDILGGMDKKYIDEAHRKTSKRNTSVWVKWGSIAACCVLVVLCMPAFTQLFPKVGDNISIVESVPDENNHRVEELPNNEQETKQDAQTTWQGEVIFDYDVPIEVCYAEPENNTFNIAVALRGAMDEYGDDVRYMVVVDIFEDKQRVSMDKSLFEVEKKRLEQLGYEVFIEENNYGAEPSYYFCIQASKQQIEEFICNEKYGYFLFLRNERIESIDAPADNNGEYNEVVNSHDITKDTSEFFGGSYTDDTGKFVIVLTEDTPENRTSICKELGRSESNTTFVKGNYTLAYLTELQDKITNAMVNKEIPFVVASGVYETSNNIIISVTTTDEAKLTKVYALDTIGGAIKVEIIDEGVCQELECKQEVGGE